MFHHNEGNVDRPCGGDFNHWRYLSENSNRPSRNIRLGYPNFCKCGFGFANRKQVVEGFLGMFQVCF